MNWPRKRTTHYASSVTYQNTAPVHLHSPLRKQLKSLRVKVVLQLQDTCGERSRRVFLTNRDGFLEDDGAAVVLGVDEVNGDAGDTAAVFEDGLVESLPRSHAEHFFHGGTALVDLLESRLEKRTHSNLLGLGTNRAQWGIGRDRVS